MPPNRHEMQSVMNNMVSETFVKSIKLFTIVQIDNNDGFLSNMPTVKNLKRGRCTTLLGMKGKTQVSLDVVVDKMSTEIFLQ